MTTDRSVNRRQFLRRSAALALAPAASSPTSAAEGTGGARFEFCTFTKALQPLSYEETAARIAALGFDGIEGAVRPKGHVEPERVGEDLPKLVAALEAEGLAFTVMTTAINEVSAEQRTEEILRAAAAAGVKRYRMGYYKYDLDKPIRPQLDEFRPRLRDLVALSRELGIKPIYQNHSGRDYFGGPVWDLCEVLAEFDPAHVGIAFDIGHATVEGGKAWPLHFATARPHLDTIYIKEPSWQDNTLGWGPVGEGAVDKGFYKMLKDGDFKGPVSLHVEYLGHGDAAIVPTVLKAIEKDFATLRSCLS